MTTKNKKKPKLGDIIEHKEPAFNRESTGTVIQLLGLQFIYETEDGQHRHCNYSELWKVIHNK